jgi:hypothetical protein
MTDAAADLTIDLESTSQGFLGVPKRGDRADAFRINSGLVRRELIYVKMRIMMNSAAPILYTHSRTRPEI